MHENKSGLCCSAPQDTDVKEQADFSARDSRSLIFHLLYAMEGFNYEIPFDELVRNFNIGFDLRITPDSPVYTIALACIENRDDLDEQIKPLLHNWRFERIGIITKLILRLALWELDNEDTPSTVVINEAIELAKCFAEQDAYKFVNGLLDERVKKNQAIIKE